MLPQATTASAPAAVEHELAIGLAARAVLAQRAQFDAEPPAFVLALDMNQVVARAAVLAARRRRSRGDADHGHRPVRPVDARHFASVIVAVQDELAADAADHRLEGGGIGQALEVLLGGERRMVDQHDAAQPFAPEIGQNPLGRGDLRLAQCAGGEERRLGHAAGQADQRDRPAPAQGREDMEAGRRRLVVARDVGAPEAEALGPCRGDIDIVVAGNDGDSCGPPSAASHSAARLNSVGSEMFTRSPVSAIWSGFWP